MKVLYNSRLLSNSSISLELDNRAFCYGDGLFETIVTGPNRLNLFNYHLDRLERGCLKLALKMPVLNPDSLNQMINQLAISNSIDGAIRAKLQVWRQSGGLYTPEKEASDFLLTVDHQSKKFYNSLESIGDCQNIRVSHSQISFAKTLNALPYILAGIEKTKGTHDDLIIKNENDQIVETIASNIFWIQKGIVYTPSLITGCVDGVMRRFLMDEFHIHNIECQEVKLKPEELLNAQSIFLTNASGISWVKTYRNQLFTDPRDFLLNSIKLQPLL